MLNQSQGDPSGFISLWEDTADLTPNTIYYYWLEDVDIYNVATLHGPVSVDFIVPTAVTLGGLQASPAAATLNQVTPGLHASPGVLRWRQAGYTTAYPD